MPRQGRINTEGALYHFISRGIKRKNIYSTNNDKTFSLELLKVPKPTFGLLA